LEVRYVPENFGYNHNYLFLAEIAKGQCEREGYMSKLISSGWDYIFF
jgi:hypothetical protein